MARERESNSKDSSASTTPWGEWEVLAEESAFKIKRITVNAGHRFSYQTHRKRAEFWVVISGTGLVTLNSVETPVKAGTSIQIPVGAPHRMANTGSTPLVFVEVQTGSYFGEDDITRLQDDFGRAP